MGNVLIPGPDTPSDFWMIFGKIEAYHQDNMITPNAGDTKGERKRRIVNNQVTVLAETPYPHPSTDRFRRPRRLPQCWRMPERAPRSATPSTAG